MYQVTNLFMNVLVYSKNFNVFIKYFWMIFINSINVFDSKLHTENILVKETDMISARGAFKLVGFEKLLL